MDKKKKYFQQYNKRHSYKTMGANAKPDLFEGEFVRTDACPITGYYLKKERDFSTVDGKTYRIRLGK